MVSKSAERDKDGRLPFIFAAAASQNHT